MTSPQLMERPALKPLSSFLSNVLQNATLTLEQAIVLNTLATPHLQYDAVMRLRRQPEQTLDQVLHDVRAQSSCKPADSPVEPRLRMSNKRWIDIAVLSLAIPLVHTCWEHRIHIGTSLSALMNSGVALAHASPATPRLEPVTFKIAPIQNPIFLAHRTRPKSVHDALNTMMDEPERIHVADARVAAQIDTSNKPADRAIDPGRMIDQNAEAAETAAADLAAAEALPITSRR